MTANSTPAGYRTPWPGAKAGAAGRGEQAGRQESDDKTPCSPRQALQRSNGRHKSETRSSRRTRRPQPDHRRDRLPCGDAGDNHIRVMRYPYGEKKVTINAEMQELRAPSEMDPQKNNRQKDQERKITNGKTPSIPRRKTPVSSSLSVSSSKGSAKAALRGQGQSMPS